MDDFETHVANCLELTFVLDIETQKQLDFANNAVTEYYYYNQFSPLIKTLFNQYRDKYYIIKTDLFMDGDGSWELGRSESGNMWLYVVLYIKERRE